MSVTFRDSRLPPELPPTNRLHTDYDIAMDVAFTQYCMVRLRFYVLYFLLDLLLIALVVSLRNIWLFLFVIISIVDIVLVGASFFFMVFNVNFSRKRKKKIGVARMLAYSAALNDQSENLSPLKRFALLTHLPTMSWWYMTSMVHIVLPLILTFVVVFTYAATVASDWIYLLLFVAVRLLITMHVYYTVTNFYAEGVTGSFRKVIKTKMQAEVYGLARSTLLVNDALRRADKHLLAVANGTYVANPPRLRGSGGGVKPTKKPPPKASRSSSKNS
jgi:hypothetical protein